jgi:hypothetical protein
MDSCLLTPQRKVTSVMSCCNWITVQQNRWQIEDKSKWHIDVWWLNSRDTECEMLPGRSFIFTTDLGPTLCFIFTTDLRPTLCFIFTTDLGPTLCFIFTTDLGQTLCFIFTTDLGPTLDMYLSLLKLCTLDYHPSPPFLFPSQTYLRCCRFKSNEINWIS